MNFTTTILTAGMLALQASAASEALANHRQALESILGEQNHYTTRHYAPEYVAPVHHYNEPKEDNYTTLSPHYAYHDAHTYAATTEPYVPVDHQYRETYGGGYYPGYHYSNETEEQEENDYYHHYGGAPHQDADPFEHVFDSEYQPHIAYRHYGGKHEEFGSQYKEVCGKKQFCDQFSKLLRKDHDEHLVRHHGDYYQHEYNNGIQDNHSFSTYFVEPDSMVVHEDSINCRLHLHNYEFYQQNDMQFRAAHLDLHLALFQDGIMQVKIKASEEEERFSISNTGIGIDWDQIKVQQRMHDFVKVLDDGVLIAG